MPSNLPTPTGDLSQEPSIAASRGTPAIQRDPGAAGVVLALQRSHGNRRVARIVSQQLARQPAAVAAPPAPAGAPPAPADRSWADQTTSANKPLGKEIDELDKLTGEAFLQERENVAVRASRYGPDHDHDVVELEAIEFLAAQRGVAPLAYRDEYYSHDGDGMRRRNIRVVLEAGIRETGSLAEAADRIDHQSQSVKLDISAIEIEANAFGRQFEIQAADFARRMLARGEAEILRALMSYGLGAEWASRGAEDLAHEDTDDVAERLVNSPAPWEADSYHDEDNKPRPARTHRLTLAQDARGLKAQQRIVEDLRQVMAAFIKHDWQRGEYVPDEVGYNAARQKFEAADRQLSLMWAKAEGHHPVLASFRSTKLQLKDVDLGGLDQVGGEQGSRPQMKTMLEHLLPKLRDIRILRFRLDHGHLKALSLPPVVAVTKAAMFVPEGSIRAGKVNDLVEAAEDKSISTYIAEGLLALIVIATLIPSGGASLGVAIGLAGAALSATSAVEDWESYKQKKMLTNTALDRAKALATEDPSLLPFAVDLVSLGLDGLPLVKAFHAISELNRLVQARREIEEAARVKQLLEELDAIGAGKKDPRLGQQTLRDLERNSHPKPPARQGTPYEPAPPGRWVWHKPPGGHYETVEALGEAVDAPLRALTHGTAEVNSEWSDLAKVDWAKLAKHDPTKAKLWADTQKIFAARRDPDRIKKVMLRVYREAGHEGVTPQAWLELHNGGASGMPALIDDGLEPEVFRDALGHEKPAIDFALAKTGHGAYVHMFDELLVEDVLGSREAARAYRQSIARAKGPARVVARGDGTTYEQKFFSRIWDGVFDSTDVGAINNADSLGEILNKYLGFLGGARP
ncbi:MAG TPA: hypothetical protein VMS64_19725 [Candidatus Methylomirabilis sp.]|nr:hypothetical protein [Candidatus Methylomirabilis sp.]